MFFRRREYKILLAPERLSDLEQCLECARNVEKACRSLRLPYEAPKRLTTGVRWIDFFDTAQGDLNQAKFALRQRTWLREGWPDKLHEFTLKFRHDDAQSVRELPMSSTLPGKQRLKEQVIPDSAGQPALCYSNKYISQVSDLGLNGMSFRQAQGFFPVLNGFDSKASLQRVGQDTIEELVMHLGIVKLASQLRPSLSLCLWRSRRDRGLLVGELSFTLKFSGWNTLEEGTRKKIDEFYLELLDRLDQWRFYAGTKTQVVYGLYERV